MKIFSEELVAKAVKELNIADLSGATIGEILLVAQYLEKETGIPFIRMDQGSPGPNILLLPVFPSSNMRRRDL